VIGCASYLQTVSRLVALASLWGPLTNAPKVFAFSALIMQTAPAMLLLSPRMSEAIPLTPVRVALCFLLIALPGEQEVFVNLTNSQWHLALLSFLILFAATARTALQRGFDTVVLLVSGLSGPFTIFLTPIALAWWLIRHGRWRLWRFCILALTSVIQMETMWSSTIIRNGGHLGATLERFVNIVLLTILSPATIGVHTLVDNDLFFGQGWLTNGSGPTCVLSTAIVAAAGLLAITAFCRGPWILRGFLAYVGLEFAAELTHGLAISAAPLWYEMQIGLAARYAFHPIAAWIAIVVATAMDRNKYLRSVGIILMASLVLVAIPSDWELQKLTKDQFHHEAKVFLKLPPGAAISFPVSPLGAMTLIKR
jgi:hypothetical protein